jgi:hypothetical protein
MQMLLRQTQLATLRVRQARKIRLVARFIYSLSSGENVAHFTPLQLGWQWSLQD